MNPITIPFIALPDYANTGAWVDAIQRVLPKVTIVAFEHMSAQDKANCTVAIVANPDPAALAELPQLLWVHSVWAGVERLLAQVNHPKLRIVRLVDPQLAQTMAEAVLAWTLYLHRDMPRYARQQRQKRWQAQEYVRPQAKTVGLLGLGALAQVAAKSLLAAHFKVSGWSRSPKQLALIDCHAGEAGLTTLLAKTDILVCLLPLTAATEGLIDANQLALLPKGASIINFARGPIIAEQPLRAALDSGHLSHAVLDVFALEPLPTDQWQWSHPNVTVLPHCSAPTDRQTASLIVAANIERFLQTGQIPQAVDRLLGY